MWKLNPFFHLRISEVLPWYMITCHIEKFLFFSSTPYLFQFFSGWVRFEGSKEAGNEIPTMSQAAFVKYCLPKWHKTQAVIYHICWFFFILPPCFVLYKLHCIKSGTGLIGNCKRVHWPNSFHPVLSGLWWKLQFYVHAMFFLLPFPPKWYSVKHFLYHRCVPLSHLPLDKHSGQSAPTVPSNLNQMLWDLLKLGIKRSIKSQNFKVFYITLRQIKQIIRIAFSS